jgi:hypothetical protein
VIGTEVAQGLSLLTGRDKIGKIGWEGNKLKIMGSRGHEEVGCEKGW